MSKKNLSRTTIEGGRAGRNKWERRNSHTVERASERDYCQRASVNSDFTEDDNFITRKEKVYKDFDDKLGPMYRWLHSQVGRIWNDVRSDVSKKFDNRTVAGRHILYDHLLSAVEEVPDLRYRRRTDRPVDETTSSYRNDFYVDDEGLLQAKTYTPRKHNKLPKFNLPSIANWLHGCVVGKIGDKFFWFVPVTKSKKYGGTTREWKTEWGYGQRMRYGYYNGLVYLYLFQEPIYIKNKEGISEISGYKPVWKPSSPNFRQERKLTDKEMVFWNSIPQTYQTKILERSPTYPENLKPKYRDTFNYYYY